MTAPVYRRVLGVAFDALPGRVRQLHDLDTTAVWAGRADVKRGPSLVARVIAAMFGLPPDGGDQPLIVTFKPAGDSEVWERNFSGRRFRSTQYVSKGLIFEAIGPITLVLKPVASSSGLSLEMPAAKFFGMPLPLFAVPRIATREWEVDGRYRFEVSATLPLFGLLVAYAGWLEKQTC